MNLLLHGIGGDLEEDLPVVTKDALAGKHGEYEIVLANPPFGILRAGLIEMFYRSRIRQNSAMNNAGLRILTNPATRQLCPRGV